MKLRIAALALGLACAVSTSARGELSREGGTGLVDVRTTDSPKVGTWRIGFNSLRYIVHPEEDPKTRSDRSVWDGGISACYGLREGIELFAQADAVFYSVGDYTPISPADGRVGAKVLLPWRRAPIETAVAGSLNLPWGNEGRGYTSRSLDPALQFVAMFPLPDSNRLTSARVHVNLGYHSRQDSRGKMFEDKPTFYLDPVYPRGRNDLMEYRAAVEFGSKRLGLFAELLLDDLLADDLAYRENPLFLTPGFRARIGNNWALTLASKIALATDDVSSTKYRTPEELYPDWQLAFGVTWSKLGPGEADHDGDGIPDFRDRCPRDGEDRDGFEDDDGCPELDNDNDGVVDRFDTRPLEPEDKDGWQDSDGVPELDNDGDGKLDAEDECPNEREDFDGVQDDDGCPEADADGDGIPDMADKCPEEAEIKNGIDDRDGCPEKVGLWRPSLLRGVIWDGADVAPAPVSFVALQELAEQLKADPVQSIEVRVHPNLSVGDPGSLLRLSFKRAEYIRGFLAASGIESSRIVASSGGGMTEAPLDPSEQLLGTGFAEIIPIQK